MRRLVAASLPLGRPVDDGDAPLELVSMRNDAPRLLSATVLEGHALRTHPVPEGAGEAIAAFLDGTQRSTVVQFSGVVPIIVGVVAAVIRGRRGERLLTWRRAVVERRIYASRAQLGAAAWERLTRGAGELLCDVPFASDAEPHPFALRDAAVHAVQRHRELAEQALAHAWFDAEGGLLFVDGGISGTERMATSRRAVGVVKSHGTLYAQGAALECILGLPQGERSSVFRITSPKRTPVASWYLRLRDAAGHDPLWGLVRVECCERDVGDLSARADALSAAVLQETSPLALPDARWDRMVYGIRDCEELLRAVS